LNGYKLKGSWVLVRTGGRFPGARGGGDRSWLLIKHRDEWSGDLDITEFAPRSVKSDGDFEDILAEDTPAVWQSHRPAKGGDAGAMLARIIERAAALKASGGTPPRAATGAAPRATAASKPRAKASTSNPEKKRSARGRETVKRYGSGPSGFCVPAHVGSPDPDRRDHRRRAWRTGHSADSRRRGHAHGRDVDGGGAVARSPLDRHRSPRRHLDPPVPRRRGEAAHAGDARGA